MPRRARPKKQKRDWRWYASTALNGIVALSMVLGTVFLFTGAPTPQAVAPTIEIPTLAPTVAVTQTVIAPTPPGPTSAITPTPTR